MNSKFLRHALLWMLLAVAATMAFAQGGSGPALTEQDIAGAAPAAMSAAEPARPAELPPNPPSVTCVAGKLTVIADNATLGSILTAVQHCINIRFDVPEDAREERTFTHLGPGPTPAILRSLLESTGDDFVIEPSASDPGTVQSVMLIARAKAGDPAGQTTASGSLSTARRAWLEERRMTRTPAAEEDSGDASGDQPTESVADAPVAESPAPSVGGDNADAAQSSVQPSAAAPVASLASNSSSGTNSGDAAGPLQGQIANMRQLFQQREQMIQTQSKTASPAPSPAPQP